MNRIFRIIRSRATGRWVVASERSASHGKSGRVRHGPVPALVLVALAATPVLAGAQTVALPVFDPTVNDNNVGATIAAGGATVTLEGPATRIVPGITGRVSTLLADLYAAGLTSDPRANPADPASLVINTGARTQIITVPDPITGGTRNVAVYVNANIIDTHASSNTFIYAVDVNGPTGGRQYVNARIGGVGPTGGTLNVAIGTAGAPTDAPENFINLGMAKQTMLFYANGTGTAASTIVWQGSNFVDMGNVGGAINAAGPGPVQYANTFVFNSYRGTFTAVDGSVRTVGNAAELQAYNTFLVGLLQTGALNPDAYGTEFNRAFLVTPNAPITFTNGPPLPDEAYQPVGIRTVIRADGLNATGVIAAGARLDVLNATIDSRVVSSVNSGGVLATNGGTVINNGQLSFRRGGNDNGAGMVILTGGHGINGGVVNAGFSSGLAGAVDPAVPVTQNFSTGVYITGAASTFENTSAGIVNVAGPGGAGVQLFTGATGSNAGTLNVGINSVLPTATSAASVTDGVRVTSAAQFTNLATGQIYLGRRPQYASGAAADDIPNNATPLAGISVTGTGSATNAGTITFGSLTQGSAGISASAATDAVLNSGVIDILGRASDSPIANIGLSVLNSTNVSNTGTINVAGVNGIGIKLLATGTTAATSSGSINVTGAMSPTGLRNYGVWSEGAGSMATLEGNVNLSGDGAIGVHARADGDVTIAGAGNVSFVGGRSQVGYFMYGAGSTITSTGTAAQDVSTPDSTLFRIEDGATLDTSSALTASGQGAVAVASTGPGAEVNVTDGSLDISGSEARGIVVEGGATGTLAAAAAVTLSGTNAVVGVSDGQKHDMAGAASGAIDPATLLTNRAAMTLDGAGALAFIAQNQGRLRNEGALSLTGIGATGVHVLSGGVLDNLADILVTNGTGIEMEGAGSQVVNAAVVEARDGTAALHLHDGGGGVVGGTFVSNGTAHTVLIGAGATSLDASDVVLISLGTGNALENAAETGAITLSNTTINVGEGAGIRTATALDPNATVAVSVTGGGTGMAFETATGGVASADLDLGSGYVIHGNGAGSTGLLAATTGTVSSRAMIAMDDAASGPALVAGTAAASTNAGALSSRSTVAPVVDLANGTGTSFSNLGVIAAVDHANLAVRGSAGADTFQLRAGAVVGVLAAGQGNDTLRWTAGSLDGSVEMGEGDDTLFASGVELLTTRHLDGGSGSDVLTLDAVVHRGGSLGNDDLDRGVNLGERWETINLTNGTGFTLTSDLLLGGSVLNIDPHSTLYAGAGAHPTIGTPSGAPVTVNNAGTIDLTNGSSGPTDTLSINGAYVGQGGRLRLDTYLNAGGPASTSDVLMPWSSSVLSGPTRIEVIYPAADGATTTGDGILLVAVADASAPDAFVLGNRVVGGAYEYLLFQGGVAASGGDPADGNWYLRNVTDDVTPPEPPEPEPPAPEPEPVPPDIPILRPEAAVYLANHAAAAGMFLHTLHDRLGEVDFSERGRSNDERRGAWTRVQRDQFDSTAGTRGQVKVGTDTSVYQMGGELGRWDDSDHRWHWGAMGGYGRADTRAVSSISGYSARGRVTAYSAGLYGTWYQTAQDARGAYLDGWVMYAGARHRVHGDALPQERYDSSAWTASVEAGYALEWVRGSAATWYIEPQLQLIHSRYSGGDHGEVNGTVEQVRDVGGLTSRLGARVYSRPVDTTHNRVQPFVEVNWWHADGNGSVAFNRDVQSLNHGRNIRELRVGAQAELGGGWTGWGHMGLRDASGDYRGVEGLLGLKYRW